MGFKDFPILLLFFTFPFLKILSNQTETKQKCKEKKHACTVAIHAYKF